DRTRHVDLLHPDQRPRSAHETARGRGDSVMDRRAFLATVAGGMLVVPFAAVAQQRPKLYRVGILSSDVAQDPRVSEIRDGLRALGYTEGQNLVVDFRWADGDLDRLPALAAELLANNVDVIV